LNVQELLLLNIQIKKEKIVMKMTPDEYREYSKQISQKQVEERKAAWKTKECQEIYRNLINAAGGFKIVRPGMRGRAKQLAISAYLKKTIPDIKQFVKTVNIANIMYEKKYMHKFDSEIKD
jgi:hypothetical protein